MEYEKMYRCKKCLTIYPKEKLQEFCPKCGNRMMDRNFLHQLTPMRGDTQIIFAKRTILGYKVKSVIKEGRATGRKCNASRL